MGFFTDFWEHFEKFNFGQFSKPKFLKLENNRQTQRFKNLTLFQPYTNQSEALSKKPHYITKDNYKNAIKWPKLA